MPTPPAPRPHFLRRVLAHGLLAAALLTPALTPAATPPPPAPAALPAEFTALEPAPLLPTDALAALTLRNPPTLQPAPKLGGPDADGTLRVETFSKASRYWDVELGAKTVRDVRNGDAALLRFQARATKARQETQEGILVCYFQLDAAPHPKSLLQRLSIGPEWTTYELPFTIRNDLPAGKGAVFFAFGDLEQSIELRHVELLHFGTRISQDRLPRTRFTYPGREADAPWRREALARIERLRTAPIDLVVQNQKGEPVPGARLELRLVHPAFSFGTAVDSNIILGRRFPEAGEAYNRELRETYNRQLRELFTHVAIENQLKWAFWVNPAQRDAALKSIDWLLANELPVRASNFFWGSTKPLFAPSYLRDLPSLETRLGGLIESHIDDIVGATRGRIRDWEVINEPMHERELLDLFTIEQQAAWFRQARRLDPAARLFINDYGMLNSDRSPAVIRRYLELAAKLQKAGAPLDGLGVQSHIGSQLRHPEDVLRDLDLLQTSGLSIQVTEFDIDLQDEQLQADYTRDFLIACYSHPALDGFTIWGFWEGQHWKPAAAMFRKDWSEKPNLQVWRDLVVNQWRTRLAGAADQQGRYAARGHKGLYEVVITTPDGKSTETRRFDLSDTPRTTIITLR
jgi:GH35 family endo-1,4-beta-xylanase